MSLPPSLFDFADETPFRPQGIAGKGGRPPLVPLDTAKLGDRFTAALDRIRYHNADNGWAVLICTVGAGRDRQEITCVGNLLDKPAEGLAYDFAGGWTTDPKWGKQFKFTSAVPVRPSDAEGIECYLASGVVKGIGETVAAAIVDEFGEDTLAVLDELDESKLQRVPGIGKAKAAAIVAQWAEKESCREQTIGLMALGLSNWLCVRVIRHFGEMGVDPLKGVMEDPYCLTEIWGVGFKTADTIGRKAGIGTKDTRRIRAACIFALQQARDEGHCYLTESDLCQRVNAPEICDLPDCETTADFLRDADGDLRLLSNVVVEAVEGRERTFWLAKLHGDETDLAKRLRLLADTDATGRQWLPQEGLQEAFAAERGYTLTGQQLEAVYALLATRLGVLTGGPGTGKTTITNAIVKLAEETGMTVGLASPTGRAAKRLEEMTGHEAMTLHRTLKWSQKAHRFLHDADYPVEYDLVVVDESSMVDVSLAQSLLAAIDHRRTHLLLVGDKDQLPSVGPGSVLNDVIGSGVAQVRELTQIMRQAEGSGIISDAHAINHGKMPALASEDCTFVEAEQPERARQYLLSMAKSAQAEGVELQILTPMRVGPLGTMSLNSLLQSALNPLAASKSQLVVGRDKKQRIYRLGDRVLQTKNDYDREVMNGDIGTVVGVDLEEDEVTVQFPETTATYGRKDLSEVDLAYALTIHKSQGSECQQVALVASWSHWKMLQRNLLYTGLTRAREKATVVGEMRAVERCVRNNRPSKRNTRLSERAGGQ